MRQATEPEKYFIFKTRQLINENNSAKLEAVVKAFGLIHDIDPTLSDADKAKFESIEALEKLRGDTEPKVFLESLTMEAMKAAGTENFQSVRRSINYYRNWLSENPNKVTLESLSFGRNPIDTTDENYALTTIHIITNDGDQQSVMATIQRLRDFCGADGTHGLTENSAYVHSDSGHTLEESREWIASKIHKIKSASLSSPEFKERLEWIDEDSDHVAFARKSNRTNNYDVVAYIATPADNLN